MAIIPDLSQIFTCMAARESIAGVCRKRERERERELSRTVACWVLGRRAGEEGTSKEGWLILPVG